MNTNIESLGIIFGVVFTLALVIGIPFGFLAYRRYLRHKEIIALAEKG